METIKTADGEMVSEGNEVFNYYDGHWGIIGPIDSDGWFDLTGDNKRTYVNGERVCVRIPQGNPFYKTQARHF